jgi:hypothetical protein
MSVCVPFYYHVSCFTTVCVSFFYHVSCFTTVCVPFLFLSVSRFTLECVPLPCSALQGGVSRFTMIGRSRRTGHSESNGGTLSIS